MNKGSEIEKKLIDKGGMRVKRVMERYSKAIADRERSWGMELQMMDHNLGISAVAEIDCRIPISAVIVVKDEKHTILNTIASVKPNVGEIIVMDTGSTDGTLEALQNLEDITLIEKEIVPWSFAKAKNYAMKQVTKPWTWVIDGDETVRSFCDNWMPVNNNIYHIHQTGAMLREEAMLPRIFPSGLTYTSDVHNELICPPDMKHVGFPDIRQIHWDMSDQKKVKARKKRSKDFIIKILNKKGKEFADYYRICKLCLSTEMWETLKDAFEKGYELWKKLDKRDRLAYNDFLLYPAMASETTGIEIHNTLEEHVNIIGETIDNMFLVHAGHYRHGDLHKAVQYGRTYLELCNEGISRPFQASAAIAHKAEVQLRVSLLNIFLENNK